MGINQEIEAKFLITDLPSIEKRLLLQGALLTHPRILEVNYRLDTPEHKLSTDSKVLRLRQDSKCWITFKYPGSSRDGVRIRQEIEFSVSDITTAQTFLNELGYQVYQIYEKYRTTYSFQETSVMLDELPFGTFIEIEGPDVASIQMVAQSLDFAWKSNVEAGYLLIYNRLCEILGVKPGNLTFECSHIFGDSMKLLKILPADH
jgi:adenylate cyclase class 2